MTSVPLSNAHSRRWRLTLFRVLATLLGLVYLPGALLMAAPWAPSSMATALPTLSPLIWAWAQLAHPDVGRWTFAFSGCVDEAIAVILFVLAWRPLARPLLLQFLALALVVDLVANVPFVPGIIVGYSPLLVLLIAYPEPRRLLTPFWRGPIDWPVLGLAAVVGAFFLPQVWQAFQAQVRGADELALNYAWASIVEHLCNLWLIALLAAYRQPGSTLLPSWSQPASSIWAWPRSPCRAIPEAGGLRVERLRSLGALHTSRRSLAHGDGGRRRQPARPTVGATPGLAAPRATSKDVSPGARRWRPPRSPRSSSKSRRTMLSKMPKRPTRSTQAPDRLHGDPVRPSRSGDDATPL